MFSPWVYIYTAFFFFFFLLFFSLVRHLVLGRFQNDHTYTHIHTHCTYITYTVKKKKNSETGRVQCVGGTVIRSFFFLGGGLVVVRGPVEGNQFKSIQINSKITNHRLNPLGC